MFLESVCSSFLNFGKLISFRSWARIFWSNVENDLVWNTFQTTKLARKAFSRWPKSVFKRRLDSIKYTAPKTFDFELYCCRNYTREKMFLVPTCSRMTSQKDFCTEFTITTFIYWTINDKIWYLILKKYIFCRNITTVFRRNKKKPF